MLLWRAQSDKTGSAAKDVAVCSSCAKYSWSASFADKICGAVLVAVPFFVFAVIICLLCAGLYDIIIMSLLVVYMCIDVEQYSPVNKSGFSVCNIGK